MSGGSHGMGKAALYVFSQIRLLVIYTKVKSSAKDSVVGKALSSRLIICQIDERIKDNRAVKRYGGVLLRRNPCIAHILVLG